MLIKIFPLLPVAIMAFIMGCRPDGSGRQDREPANHAAVVQPGELDRYAGHLQYTKHARCRMDCRHITTNEVRDILLHGMVNGGKSDPGDRPCPTYALEGYTLSDHQHVRIIFAQCNRTVRVVTCIDLDHDFTCNCR